MSIFKSILTGTLGSIDAISITMGSGRRSLPIKGWQVERRPWLVRGWGHLSWLAAPEVRLLVNFPSFVFINIAGCTSIFACRGGACAYAGPVPVGGPRLPTRLWLRRFATLPRRLGPLFFA